LLLLLCLALLVRLVYVFVLFADHQPVDDEVHYHAMALNIMQGNGPMIDGNLLVYRLPGTSFYLALVYSVIGVSLRAAQLANVVLGVLTVWLVYDFVRRMFSASAATWSAFFATTYPMLALYAAYLLSETPTLFLIALVLWLAWRARSGSLIWLVLLGLTLGLSALTREIMLPAAALVVSWLLVNPPERRFTLRHVANVIVVIVLLGVVLTPWVVRNHRITGRFILLTSAGGTRLWYANNPFAVDMGQADLGGRLGLQARIPEVEALPENERDAAYKSRALRFIAEDPLRFVGLAFRRQLGMWHLGYHRSGLREIVFLLYYWPLLALALLGTVIAWRENRSALFLLAIIPFVVAGVSAVFQGVGRYRVPAELILCALGGLAVSWLWRRWGAAMRLASSGTAGPPVSQ